MPYTSRAQWLADAIALLVQLGALPPITHWPLETLEGKSKFVEHEALLFRASSDSAILFYLREDLERLSKVTAAELSAPLAMFLGRPAADQFSPLAGPLPAPLPINIEQEEAIWAGLTQPLSVVTGPPGTGKSQVLANAVATCVAEGKTVLLASWSNQALNVVVERIRDTHPEAAPIRAGARKYQAETSSQMSAALAASPTTTAQLAPARAAWDSLAKKARPRYVDLATRLQALRRRDELAMAIEATRAELPSAVRPAGAFGLEIDATSALLARARQPTPPVRRRSWWQFWRSDAPGGDQTDLIGQLIDLAAAGSPSSHSALRTLRINTSDGVVVRTIETLTRLAILAQERSDVLTELAHTPSEDVMRSRIDNNRPGCHVAANLSGEAWASRVRGSGAQARSKAASYASSFASLVAKNQSAAKARPQFPDVLPVLPVWAVTSMATASLLPFKRELFDVVIIDEASQHDIPSALPLLFRAKRVMVIGDPHQLTPIATIPEALERRLASDLGITDDELATFSYKTSSLYLRAEASTLARPTLLIQHFRSHPDIIGFANEFVYDSQLDIRTDPSKFLPGPAALWLDTKGAFDRDPNGRSALNRHEAECVVDAVLRQVQELSDLDGPARSVGVVTPFRAQADLIARLLDERAPELTGHVTVDTAYKYQGSERDVIIFSPVITGEMPLGTVRFAGNPNLVNVAVTRARARLIVVGDRAAILQSSTLLAHLARWISDR